MKNKKYKCLKCGELLEDLVEVRKHKEEHWDHFEYSKIGTRFRVGFA